MEKEDIITEILTLLQSANKPFYIKEIAERLGISANTAGKYVNILDAKGIVKIEKFATAKVVSLLSKGVE
jgi:Mn-dependent DtxR family transcriptional regulator